MLEIIVDHGIDAKAALVGGHDHLALLRLVFHHDIGLPGAGSLAHRLGKFGQDMLVAFVEQRLHSVDTQPIDVKVSDPIGSIADNKVAHGAGAFAVIIEGGAPFVFVAGGEEVLAVGAEMVAHAHMVVNDIKDHPEPEGMGAIDEAAHGVGFAIGGERGIGEGHVIAPAETALEGADGHDLDNRNAGVLEVLQPLGRRGPGAFGGKGANMKFIKHLVLAVDAGPAFVRPGEIGGHHHRSAVAAIGLPARGEVRQARAAIEAEPVARAGAYAGDVGSEKALASRVEGKLALALDVDGGGLVPLRPEREACAAVMGDCAKGFW